MIKVIYAKSKNNGRVAVHIGKKGQRWNTENSKI